MNAHEVDMAVEMQIHAGIVARAKHIAATSPELFLREAVIRAIDYQGLSILDTLSPYIIARYTAVVSTESLIDMLVMEIHNS